MFNTFPDATICRWHETFSFMMAMSLEIGSASAEMAE